MKYESSSILEKDMAEYHRKAIEKSKKKLPQSVDWREFGAVTEVKNQGICGACWAFSTTGSIEGAKAIATNELVSLSEQQLLDCDNKDDGCEGGMMMSAFEYDERTAGLCSEEAYSYIGKKNKKCLSNKCTAVPNTKVKFYVKLRPSDNNSLLSLVARQPVSVAIQAGQPSFQFYESGVFSNDECGKDGDVDHGVLVVGYGTDEDTNMDYYLVKNSWGSQWGEEGYVRIERNLNMKYGMCSILRIMTAPFLDL